eukprot:CAMPEP_0174708600 /NCGR_PEP_ID=MMETSP1094-20130205/10814_1 /TAXON_ID=156173 /ORGANISM="Chrysochromulina brevifilum, Strain UTEX LB 985" /LENGTH=121 /DNA_ID=CAMNT_0015907181 /DNA_START=37 /DNA_END=402 /DNA_ORIENTATION=+
MTFSKLPLNNTLAIARHCFAAVIVGSPERVGGLWVAPALRINRLLFGLVRPLLPVSTQRKIHFLARAADMRAHLRRELGWPDDDVQVPCFLGGLATHEVPRTSSGDLDLGAMLQAIVDADG